MPRTVLVDAYNVLRNNRRYGSGSEDPSARDRFLSDLAEYASATGDHVVAVFDGHGEDADAGGGLRVVYGRERDADLVIETMAGASASETLVVSGDRALREAAARHGVVCLNPSQFVEEMTEQRRLVDDQVDGPGRRVDVEEQINPTVAEKLRRLTKP